MSSPVVETVRTIPLIIERNFPMEDSEINTGYPFDRESDRDGYLRSQLDDIAKRHPEIAEHLEGFAQRDRPRSQQSTEAAGSPRRFPRQFGERFERFGFPFDRDDFEPDYCTEFQPKQEFRQPYAQQQSTTYNNSPPPEQSQAGYSQSPNQSGYNPSTPTPNPPEPERCNLQQSSTFDLGQKQEPVNDRSQRSMSAPPSENTPLNQSKQTENMSQSHSHSETKSSNERIIPIHIEGRDEPVLPKNIPPSYSQQHQSGPQPDRLFGKPTEHFTQFLPHERDSRWHQGFTPEEPIRQQRFHPQHAQQRMHQEYAPSQHRGEIPIPVQREVPINKTQQQPEKPQQQRPPQQQRSASPASHEQKTGTPPPQPKALSPLEQIQAIQKDVSSLIDQVQAFNGKPRDKQYLYLDEMLTRNLIKLDNIDTQGQESIRSARKEAIKNIEKTISILEAKAAASSDAPEAAEITIAEVEPPQEGEKFPKEGEPFKDSQVSSEDSKEMEIDEKSVDEKMPESSTTLEKNNLELMEVEPSPKEPTTEETAEKMETIEEPPSVTSGDEKNEVKKEMTPVKEENPEQKKNYGDATENKNDPTVVVQNPSEIETIAVQQAAEGENSKDVTTDNVKTEEMTENDSKEKKDKKKGKKKAEKSK